LRFRFTRRSIASRKRHESSHFCRFFQVFHSVSERTSEAELFKKGGSLKYKHSALILRVAGKLAKKPVRVRFKKHEGKYGCCRADNLGILTIDIEPGLTEELFLKVFCMSWFMQSMTGIST